MSVDSNFPKSPFTTLDPHVRWRPGTNSQDEIATLIAPLVHKLRLAVRDWRNQNYEGASETTKALLNWWFHTPHPKENADGSTWNFQYYFAQQEAVETAVYLADVVGAFDPTDLLQFDSSRALREDSFSETWPRYVIKMATGSGKTKVMSLLLAWSYFHRLYEHNSPFSRNFLVIAPNVIVLERLRTDFDHLKIFYTDPVLPSNGYEGRDWERDFQLKVHIQDKVMLTESVGNIFLTNIHRVYESRDKFPTIDDDDVMDYFLGKKPNIKRLSGQIELEDIVRDIEELMVINDEAHHVHDESLAWYKSIQDIANQLKFKGSKLSLQVDVTATPKHTNGAIFAQTISDYPLVEAITQNVVKTPVVPDGPSRSKLQEHQSSKFSERYADYLRLGVEEWQKSYEHHLKLDRKAVLFVMTDDTKNCDEVKDWLELNYKELSGKVLVIHTNKKGEISESTSGAKKKELEELRQQANLIDSFESPYKAIVSVLMLKEGWDVQNVTTIVGLRAFSSTAKILPEQTLGRGLRRMYRGKNELVEKVSVMGTPAFMDFVETINDEGVELEKRAMGKGTEAVAPVVIEVDRNDLKKDLETLDIEIPKLSRRFARSFKRLEDLDISQITDKKVSYKHYREEELREIVFKEITTTEFSHTTHLSTVGDIDPTQAIGWFAMKIQNDLRLVGGYDVIYGKLKDFIRNYLFDRSVDLDDRNTMRNLSDAQATMVTLEGFKTAINELTLQDSGSASIVDSIKLRDTKSFPVNDQEYVVPRKSIFNRIVGDSHLELRFANYLDECEDVVAFAKLYQQIGVKIDYVDSEGKLRDYYPDFIVKLSDKRVYIVETKGALDVDVPRKIERLKSWCEDVNRHNDNGEVVFDFVYVQDRDFDELLEAYADGLLKGKGKLFSYMVESFRDYKD